MYVLSVRRVTRARRPIAGQVRRARIRVESWSGTAASGSSMRTARDSRDGRRRYATGIRSVVAMAWNHQVGQLYALQHGRDDLYRSSSQFYSRWQSAVLPSEEFFKVTDGFDGGWPDHYYDWMQDKKLLNPEYGGDGVKVGKGNELAKPLIGFPGHWAPNDLLFYDGDRVPERYRHGAFIAFHGSTIRMPDSQAGYFVAFVPFEAGAPSGPWEVFADGFAAVDPIVNTSNAAARPMGLAQGPDGSLYVNDSEKGKIWRVMFKGNRRSFGAAAARANGRPQAAGAHPYAGRGEGHPRTRRGRGWREVVRQYRVVCHQRDGKGDGARFPSLVSTRWVSNSSRLISLVLNGLQGEIDVEGKKFNGVMPAHAFMSDEEVAQLLTFLRQNFGNHADTVEAAEVAKVRARPKPD